MLTFLLEEVKKSPLAFMSIGIAFLSFVFVAFPQIDLTVSGWFYDGQPDFWARQNDFLRRLRYLGITASRLIIILLVLFVVLRLIFISLKKLFPIQKVIFLLVSCAMGPGLIVNVLLKSNWGRARPIQTDIFGGVWPYSDVWVIVDHCKTNCSFVSGEGAVSIWMLGVALLVPEIWRKTTLMFLLVFAVLMSGNRIAFGGHYLSDILLSWAIVGWAMLLCRHWMQSEKFEWTKHDYLENCFDNAGNRLCSIFRKTTSR